MQVRVKKCKIVKLVKRWLNHNFCKKYFLNEKKEYRDEFQTLNFKNKKFLGKSSNMRLFWESTICETRAVIKSDGGLGNPVKLTLVTEISRSWDWLVWSRIVRPFGEIGIQARDTYTSAQVRHKCRQSRAREKGREKERKRGRGHEEKGEDGIWCFESRAMRNGRG